VSDFFFFETRSSATGSIVDEATGSIVDEPGSFRHKWSAVDQILILREVLASREERGLPTYGTYKISRKVLKGDPHHADSRRCWCGLGATRRGSL
jgi:hypothetical protein